jgi:hypothetical protein
LGIQTEFAWDCSFNDVRIQGCVTPATLGNQTNNIAFNSCKFVSFTTRINTSNCEGILFDSCDLANFTGTGSFINIYQSGITFLNCYYESLGQYPTTGSNISVQNSRDAVTNLNIIGGKVTMDHLYVSPANSDFFATKIYGGDIVVVPYNASPSSTDNPAVSVNMNSLDMDLGINRFNSVVYFDGKNDVTLYQYTGGTFTQTFTNGIKELKHTSESLAGISLDVEADSLYILIIEAKLPDGVTSLAFQGNGSATYGIDKTPINNRWILPFASKDSTKLRVRWTGNGTVELSELKLKKVA